MSGPIHVGALVLLLCTLGASRAADGQDLLSPPYLVDQWTTEDGLPSHTIQDIAQPAEGYLWLATNGGLVRFDGHRFQVFTPLGSPGLSESRLVALRVGEGDTLWIRAENGEVFSRADGRFAAHGMGARADVFPEDASKDSAKPPARSAPPGVRLGLVDRSDRRWAVYHDEQHDASVTVYAPGAREAAWRFTVAHGVLSMAEDREGNLWVGSGTEGLLRIRTNPFLVFAKKAPATETAFGLPHNTDTTLSLEGGALYRTDAGGRRRLAAGVRTAYQDPDGRLWFERDSTLYLRTRGEEVRVDVAPGVPVPGLQIFYADPNDPRVLWLYRSDYFIDRYYRATVGADGRPLVEEYRSPHTPIRRLFVDRSGTLWIATQKGLVRRTGDEWTTFTTADGLPVGRIRAIHEDAEGVLWVGTYGGGIVRYRDGRFASVGEQDGLAEDVVSTIHEDAAGHFWMAGNRGIHRVLRDELNAFLDGRANRVHGVLYDRRAGLTNPETSGAASYASPDGRLWFPTFGGTVVVDPAAVIAEETKSPRVHVEAVVADGEPVARQPDVRLTARQRRFDVEYTGISLRNPASVRYRYRLDGFDPDWIEAGGERSATYTNVPAGRYTFLVQATSAGADWSEEAASVPVMVAPFFYETAWFLLLSGLVLAGLLFGGYRLRVRSLKARSVALNDMVVARTEALVDEKRRTERALETVAAQAEQLRTLDEAKTRFFANVSHEFRTPLQLIIGPLEDLLHAPADEADTRRQLGLVARNARRLLRLVNQLLDAAYLESGQVKATLENLDVAAFAERLVDGFRPAARRAEVELQMKRPLDPLPARLDANHLEKVLTNLLGNALKYTPAGGHVTLALSTEPRREGEGCWLVFTVSDDGAGIPAADLPHVFERFYRSDESRTRSRGGVGIGLALTHELVLFHGGRIEVETEEGAGSTFHVRLPWLPPAPGEAGGLEAPELLEASPGTDEPLLPHAAPRRPADGEEVPLVLVVDDSEDVRTYVRRHLETRYRVAEAPDGRSALALTRLLVPDLVVSDVMMPEMDGFALCQALRRDPELDFIPVLLLTARASTESQIEGLAGGADGYLTKPFDARVLAARVDNLIASRKRLRARFATPTATSAATPTLPFDVPPEATSEDLAFLEAIHDALRDHLDDESFGVDDLAREVGHSRTNLYRRLRASLDLSPMELLWEVRLTRAAQLLQTREGTVSEVAYGVGFKSLSHFSRRFRERYGVTPVAYSAGEAAAKHVE